MSSLMHNGAETQGIVEASAEHDSHGLRLSKMICAFDCLFYYFYAACCPFFTEAFSTASSSSDPYTRYMPVP